MVPTGGRLSWQATREMTNPDLEPEVSVIIPTFKRPAELAEAISSVLRQARSQSRNHRH